MVMGIFRERFGGRFLDIEVGCDVDFFLSNIFFY